MTRTQTPDWRTALAPYAVSDSRRSAVQVVVTTVLLGLGFALMLLSLDVGYWLTLLLAIPTAGLQVRLFVLFHDMTHGSLFSTKRTNDVLGILVGLVCYTPYHQWRRRHLLHHATSGNLSRRGWWEIPTATTDEYAQMTRSQAWAYRLTRSPSLLFTIGALSYFVIIQRMPAPGAGRRERINLWGTNLALIGLAAGAVALLGWAAVLAVWLPVALLSSATGMWLFYVQHQFEDAYWQSAEEWSFYDAAMSGSSLLRLPPVASWFFTGIGFHHIHHLNPRVPNYRLATAHADNPEFHSVTTMGVMDAMRCVRANVWDGTRMVSFRQARKARRQGPPRGAGPASEREGVYLRQ